jgi:undecaprenyl diphosphate synthase
MVESGLRHLALVVGDPPGRPGEAQAAVAGAVRRAAATATAAFAAVPELRAFSFVAPGIDRLLAVPASAAPALAGCLEAAAALEDAAARGGAALRLCGRKDGLPDALTRHADRPRAAAGERTVLWFLRYGGRDEISRAAARFFRENPGAQLGDDDLDRWLDTAGVPDPDLIVLAGGPLVAPDALVWQGSYAELWHTPKPWAEFTAEDLRRAIADYHTRQRRFGG